MSGVGGRPEIGKQNPLRLEICDTYYLEKDDVKTVSADFSQLAPNASLKIPAGKYVVMAKALLTNVSADKIAGFDCRLMVDGVVGNDFCHLFVPKRSAMMAESSPDNGVILSMMHAGHSAQGGFANLICRSGSPGARISMIRMTAFRVDCLQESHP